ncbi:PDZ domain-containing protein [Candidatus Pacearchaeota archaeon]|nr:PDZ domain-containing protein [Candidatus Pacearchaeota archaeon]
MNFKFTWRMWVLIIALILSVLAIVGNPMNLLASGVIITNIDQNSTAFDQGLRQGQIITEIDGQEISNIDDYSNIMLGKFNGADIKTTIQTKNQEFILLSNKSPEITVSELQKTNIKTGLDISGGSRALVKAQEKKLTQDQADELKQVLGNRLNVYGIEDIRTSTISDLSGDYYVNIEIPGATPAALKELISQQGKFEAKIGNETVFVGGKDISSVSRSGQDAVVESCQRSQDFYFCNFRFTVYLNEDAAKRHADITRNLSVNFTGDGYYLSEKLDLFLDDKLVDSLLISEGLKGMVTTQISISGAGTGETEQQAYDDAKVQMNKLQTILITGSLPYKLEIIKLDTISPLLGKGFTNSIILAGLAAILAVSVFIFIRYRNFKLSLALLLTSFSEVIIILGIASLIKWNLDLPSIAGILATIGTGIDQQIIILDEAKQRFSTLKQRLKTALVIIVGAYFTAFVSLIPLYWVAAGFFKGFAITTLIGITAGILITRPAFSDIVERVGE